MASTGRGGNGIEVLPEGGGGAGGPRSGRRVTSPRRWDAVASHRTKNSPLVLAAPVRRGRLFFWGRRLAAMLQRSVEHRIFCKTASHDILQNRKLCRFNKMVSRYRHLLINRWPFYLVIGFWNLPQGRVHLSPQRERALPFCDPAASIGR
jgi:hypothetical protein